MFLAGATADVEVNDTGSGRQAGGAAGRQAGRTVINGGCAFRTSSGSAGQEQKRQKVVTSANLRRAAESLRA